jgi:hypothetical protein
MKRSLSINLSVVALLAVLWQAESSAQTKRNSEGHRRPTASGQETSVSLMSERGRGRRLARPVSRMGERAKLYEPYIAAAAREYGVDPRALWTIAFLETRFRPWLISPKNARGLMQFIPQTARRYRLRDPHNAKSAICASARYVRDLSTHFWGRLDLVLAAYNSGEGTVDAYLTGRTIRTRDDKIINPRGLRTGGIPPYPETQKYVSRGLFVYLRVTTVGLFNAELIAQTRALAVPEIKPSASLIQSIDKELDELAGRPTLTGNKTSQPAASSAVVARSFAPRIEDAPLPVQRAAQTSEVFEEVFFDIHSGVRYLVKGGQVVRPMEALPVDSGVPVAKARKVELGRNTQGSAAVRVARSIYYGSRRE